MNPNILGVIGPGFLNQVPTLTLIQGSAFCLRCSSFLWFMFRTPRKELLWSPWGPIVIVSVVVPFLFNQFLYLGSCTVTPPKRTTNGDYRWAFRRDSGVVGFRAGLRQDGGI